MGGSDAPPTGIDSVRAIVRSTAGCFTGGGVSVGGLGGSAGVVDAGAGGGSTSGSAAAGAAGAIPGAGSAGTGGGATSTASLAGRKKASADSTDTAGGAGGAATWTGRSSCTTGLELPHPIVLRLAQH